MAKLKVVVGKVYAVDISVMAPGIVYDAKGSPINTLVWVATATVDGGSVTATGDTADSARRALSDLLAPMIVVA